MTPPDDYVARDRAVWEKIFADIPPEWYEAPPSDAMLRCRAYFEEHPCARVLDVGCGFGRWARFLAGNGVDEIVGVDYAELGIRAACGLAQRAGFNGRFIVASALALPFEASSFDGVLAALLLDNLSRPHGLEAVRSLNRAVGKGARGFFVFNPVPTVDASSGTEENPTKDCMHVVYGDHELVGCLPGWEITGTDASAEGFRLVEATFVG